MRDFYNQKWVLLFKQKDATSNAVTICQTTFYSEPKEVVLADTEWVLEEHKHKEQWKRDGIKFPFKYLYYHFKYGYEKNPYEIEAKRR